MEAEWFKGVGGAFRMLDTFGLPLVMTMEAVEKYGMRVACDVFIYDALVSGWKFEKAIGVVWEAWADKYGPNKANEARIILENGCKKAIANGILKTHRVSEVEKIKRRA